MRYPVIVFAFNRAQKLKELLTSLEANFGAIDTDVIIFIDGCRSLRDEEKVAECVKVAELNWRFKSKKICKRGINLGLASSIISGLDFVSNEYEAFIVLEDDLKLHPGFLNFMNLSLGYYLSDTSVFSISGWSLKLRSLASYPHDVYFHRRHSSWGWAMTSMTWKNIVFDKQKIREKISKTPDILVNLNQIGSDLPKMLIDCLDGKNDSWAVRACLAQCISGKYTVAPTDTLVLNQGFSEEATNTRDLNFYDQDSMSLKSRWILFEAPAAENSNVISEFRTFFSVRSRIWRRILSMLGRLKI